jgi:glutamate-ammonia-ligase adenylyltransferase
VPTAAGALYEIDTRLRPSGAQGPLVVSLAGFAKYQQENAWTWEHMALTRARPVFGSRRARQEVTTVIDTVLTAPRDLAKLIADAVDMRAEMARHKPPKGALDAKLSPGGLVDLEFAVHVAQLSHPGVAIEPDLDPAIEILAREEIVPTSLGEDYRFLTRMLVLLRLVAPDNEPPSPPTRELILRSLGADSWDALVARFDATRQEVARVWQSVSGEKNGGT